jgi:surfeit locus 1 family protein
VTRVPRALTIFVVIMLPAVISLGFWQLQRAEEKQALEARYLDQLGAPVVGPAEEIEPFTRLRLEGTYEDQRYLVDNQIAGGQVGYWIIQLFRHANGAKYLVNRGWVAAPADRSELPEVGAPSGEVSLSVLAWPQMGLPPLLAEDQWAPGEQVRVQRRDIEQMAQRSGAYPMEMRLEPGSPGILLAAPQTVEFGRQKHLGYALQWFGLGLVLIVGYIVVYRRGRVEKT